MQPCNDWKTLCQPSSKQVPFSNWGKVKQQKEKDGLHLSFAMPKMQWDSNPTASMAIMLWETFTFFNLTLIENVTLIS